MPEGTGCPGADVAEPLATALSRLAGPQSPPGVRCAALVVIGELGLRDRRAQEAVTGALDDAEPAVRAQAAAAAAAAKLEAALPALLRLARAGGVDVEAAAGAAAQLGPKGASALRRLMEEVPTGIRRRIASALPAGESAGAEAAAVGALLDTDPGVVDAAARSLLARVPSLDTAHRRRLAEQALKALDRADGLSPASEAALVRLLGALDDRRAEKALWERTGAAHPPQTRAAALQALASRGTPSDERRLRRLFECAADADFRVAAPALLAVRPLPAARNVKHFLRLLAAPEPAVRVAAMERLAEVDRAEVVAALAGQLDHPDEAVRSKALAALGELRRGRAALAQVLLKAQTPDAAWFLARAQAPFAGKYPSDIRQRLFNQACKYLEADDRRAEPLLFLLREADAGWLRERLAQRASAHRKRGADDGAQRYFRILLRDPACPDAVRFEAAATALRASAKDLSPEARAADPALSQFASLVGRQALDLPKPLAKTSWLDAEDLFYLGFHFVERRGSEQAFGAAVLRLLAKRFPRSKRVKEAANKLRSHGLEGR